MRTSVFLFILFSLNFESRENLKDNYFMHNFRFLAIAFYVFLTTKFFSFMGVAIFPIPSVLASVAVRAALIYLLSALLGSLASTMFVQRNPAVGSSSALFGLVGATLAGLVRDWKTYVAKVSQLLKSEPFFYLPFHVC